MHAASFQSMQSGFDEGVINTDSADLHAEFLDAQFVDDVLLDGMARLRTKTAHALVGVVARKSSQVHTRNRAQQPSCLPVFLHSAPRDLRLCSAFDRAGVDANLLQPVQIKRNPRVRQERSARESCDRVRRVLLTSRDFASGSARVIGIVVFH